MRIHLLYKMKVFAKLVMIKYFNLLYSLFLIIFAR